MKLLKTTLMSSLPMAALIAGIAIASGDDADASEAAIALSQAKDIALSVVPGNITETEMEKEDGQLIWEIEVSGDDDQHYEIEIDAMTGEVLEKEVEND